MSHLWENQKYSYKYLKDNFSDRSNWPTSYSPDLKDTDPATPCGSIAKSMFNDTFELYYAETKDKLLTSEAVN